MEGHVVDEAKWYVVHTYSSYENKVKMNIEQTVKNRNMEDLILEVRVPMQDETEEKDGQRVVVQRKVFPGYVLIHMVVTDDTWYVVRNTRGVTGFVGPDSKPVPLSMDEVYNMGIEVLKPKLLFEVGDVVKILGGAFEDSEGVVDEIIEAKDTAIVIVTGFGREVPVEVSIDQVQKVVL